MSKYLDRQQTVNMFGYEMYPHIKEEELSIQRLAWKSYLEELNKEGKITNAQMKVWVYPQKEMERYK